MGRAVAIRGERRLGRTIRKLEDSVELSPKENKAKTQQQKFRQQAQASRGYTNDSPIQNLRDPANWKKEKQQNT